MENNKQLSTVEINGKQVIDFTPQSTRPQALVDFDVVKRLAALLPTSSFDEIKNMVISNIRITNDLPEMINVMQGEIAFQQTVNLLNEYQLTQLVEQLM